MFKKMLVAVDGSDLSFKALEHAAELAQMSGGELLLLTVADETTHTQHKRLGLFEEYTEKDGKVQLYNDILNTMGEYAVKYKVRNENGKAADVIIDVAKEVECDTIVMGSRGLSGITELFCGSVSHEVIHRSEVPVIIVK